MTNNITLFDTHCHLDFPQFGGNLNKMIIKSEEAGISGILIPGVKRDGWRAIRQITATHSICHTALGLHPMFVEQHTKSHLHDLEMALSVGPIAAIGEIGLDFYNSTANRSMQIHFVTSQISIAKSAELPIVLHVRKAHDEMLKIITQMKFKGGGIVHAFNGSEHQAQKYCDLGFKLGFGGAMTYPRAAKLHRLAATLPLESIVLETDAPDMPPVTCQQKYNTPLHLFDNFRSLVTLRQESAAQIAMQTTINAHAILNLN
ncbi:MAG: TatD family hydrolase [Kangiellaceae bacterium]|nr:TatD family hydrolase [Kangiellaceae bacterium]